ncbi:MAG TPA: LytTR family DNA-binding domain-containing protein [Candidatus Dormibacteraeota bacterium]|nr:LytTR family DNA-binding domain-containing protein [Candidatus Dormibacteraeota bacterium]
MLRTLVVDDEKLARDRLCGFLRGIEDVEIVGEAANGPEAVALIEDRRPDLVLLDVQMPGMDGFGVLRQLTHRPAVVFATAYDDYAIKAFDVQAADYLLKPISRDRLREAVRRIRDRRARTVADAEIQQAVRALQQREKRYAAQLTVQKGRQILLLATSDVYWFEVEYRLVYAHTAGERFMSNYTLKDLETRLDPEVFFRAHKSRLVNLHRVKAIVPWFGGRYKLVMRNPAASEVELSRAQARVLRRRMHW